MNRIAVSILAFCLILSGAAAAQDVSPAFRLTLRGWRADDNAVPSFASGNCQLLIVSQRQVGD